MPPVTPSTGSVVPPLPTDRMDASATRIRWANTPNGEITLAAAFLFALTLAVFGGVLFGPCDIILSNIDTDLAKQFVHWRTFGFGELRAGHLALWNPHIYSGAPYLGGFQSALLYPPNWLYLCLPLGRAINIGIALHVFLAGLFMFFWTRRRNLHPLACTFAGVLFMFSGPYFPHIYAGHLPNLCTMVWAPLLFLAIDGWLESRTLPWLLLGAGAIALQIFAGHPQYVFYTGVAAGLYSLLHLRTAPRRLQATAGLGAMVAGGVGLSAIQLFEGFHAAAESARGVGLSMDYAAMFSFPPENFLTLLVPGFFGDLTDQVYWGRCFLWEMSLFIGLSGLSLAVYGAFRGEPVQRRFCALLFLALLVPALGAHTPLFRWLYLYAPGFDKFRGWSKFTFPAILFLIMLAAVGFDHMLRHGPAARPVWITTLAAGVLFVGAAGWSFQSARADGIHGPRPWGHWMRTLNLTGEQAIAPDEIRDADNVRRAARFAGGQLLLAAATMLTLGGLLRAAQKHPRALWAVFALGVVEMSVFAMSTLDTMRLGDVLESPAADFLRAQPAGDDRILNTADPDLAMSVGARDLWGYDPGVVRRYAEWMAATQGMDPGRSPVHTSLLPLEENLLRCRYLLQTTVDASGNETLHVAPTPAPPPAPRLRLLNDVRLMPWRGDILAAMNGPSFDPGRSVILEQPPEPPPAPGGPPGVARVADETSDSLTIEADLPAAAVLLVTDTYCTGWQAHSLLLPGLGKQTDYQVLPADYCLRAIPLAAGRHRVLLEYRPRAYVVGLWTTLLSLSAYAALAISHLAARRKL